MSKEMAFGVTAFALAVLVLLAIYLCWWRRLLRRIPRVLPAKKASALEVEELERSIGGGLPAALRAAYIDGSLADIALPIVFQSDEKEFAVAGFLLMEAESNSELLRWHGLPSDAFVFGSDDFGNFYLVRAVEYGVYFWDHEMGTISKEFESMEVFFNALRMSRAGG